MIKFFKKIKKIKELLYKYNPDLIFFFPYFHTGGAEKVHLQIIKNSDKKKLIIFTDKSKNDHFKSEFGAHAEIFELYPFHTNRRGVYFFKKIIVRYLRKVNSSKIIFGCNSFLFYDIVNDNNNNKIISIDLLHAFSKPDYGIEDYSIKVIDKISKRIVINKNTLFDYIHQYKENRIKDIYLNRIFVIENGIEIPENLSPKQVDGNLNILYSGRNSIEKRPEIFIDIARQELQYFKFSMMGDLDFFKSDKNNERINFLGNVLMPDKVNDIYNLNDVLVITSYREGFPMVIMEAMSRGIICICTNVGGIAEHIKNDENGFLVKNESADQIKNDVTSILLLLQSDENMRKRLSSNAITYSKDNFNITKFNKSYLQLFNI